MYHHNAKYLITFPRPGWDLVNPALISDPPKFQHYWSVKTAIAMALSAFDGARPVVVSAPMEKRPHEAGESDEALKATMLKASGALELSQNDETYMRRLRNLEECLRAVMTVMEKYTRAIFIAPMFWPQDVVKEVDNAIKHIHNVLLWSPH